MLHLGTHSSSIFPKQHKHVSQFEPYCYFIGSVIYTHPPSLKNFLVCRYSGVKRKEIWPFLYNIYEEKVQGADSKAFLQQGGVGRGGGGGAEWATSKEKKSNITPFFYTTTPKGCTGAQHAD